MSLATPVHPGIRESSLPSAVPVAAPGQSAVSWGAIFAGAAASAALALILLILGVGLGLSSVSPWAQAGVDATTFGVSAICWLTFTQLAASGIGGYLAGRLRTKWVSVHGDEAYFRDTAHGFLSWAVASLVTAAVLGSAVGAIVSGGASAVGGVAKTATTAATAGVGAAGMAGASKSSGDPMAYWTDGLFRRAAPDAATGASAPAATGSTTPAMSGGDAAPTAEAGRILANALHDGSLAPADQQYLGQLVAQRTGLSQQDAVARVNKTFDAAQAKLRQAETTAKEDADKARKASAYAALWLFITLLIGAFVASFAATFGGRQRDL